MTSTVIGLLAFGAAAMVLLFATHAVANGFLEHLKI
jgi:hypothetical protein